MAINNSQINPKVEPVRQHEVQGDESAAIPCSEVSDSARLCKEPLVSVIMITYNHEPYIRDAIEGVVSQRTDFLYELIIGEDFSTDKTRDIVLEYQKKYPEIIRVLGSDSNVGMLNNGRRTSDACRGAYIAYCEGDDYWTDENKLQEQIQAMRRHPECEVSFHPAMKVKAETGEQMGIMGQIYDHETILSASEVIDRGIAFMPTCSLCVKAQFFCRKENIDFFRKHGGSFLVKFLPSINGGALYINHVFSAYRASSIGSWTQTARENPEFAVRSFESFFSATYDDINEMTDFKFKDAIERLRLNHARAVLCRRDISVEARKRISLRYMSGFSLLHRCEIFIASSNGVYRLMFYYPYRCLQIVCGKTRSVFARLFFAWPHLCGKRKGGVVE